MTSCLQSPRTAAFNRKEGGASQVTLAVGRSARDVDNGPCTSAKMSMDVNARQTL